MAHRLFSALPIYKMTLRQRKFTLTVAQFTAIFISTSLLLRLPMIRVFLWLCAKKSDMFVSSDVLIFRFAVQA